MQNDISLVRMVIADLAEKHNWSYEETLERFYRSNTYLDGYKWLEGLLT